jgi:crotonobetainyl-CoA:carnitine CoA-transferase CaiB-like acyl-CoA transferase
LCHVAIIGEAPPRDGAPGHDLTYQAVAGLVSPPHLPVSLLADLGGALEAVVAALALLTARDRGGAAGCARVALADAAHYFAQPRLRGLTGRSTQMLGGGYALYNIYPAAEGWVAVAGLEGHFREKLLAHFPGEGSEHERLATGFARRTAADWHAWAEIEDLPIVAVASDRRGKLPG